MTREFAEKAAEPLGLEIVDTEYVKENGNRILRIFIDKEGGVATDDCERISRAVEKDLDAADPIEGAYHLEVSSAGLDRPLKRDADFERFSGRLVDIKLYQAKEGKKRYQGTLQGLQDGIVTILLEEEQEVAFERKEIASIRLAVVF